MFSSLGTLLLPHEQGQANLLNNEICSSVTSTAPANTQKQRCLPDLQLTTGTCGSPCGTKTMWNREETLAGPSSN